MTGLILSRRRLIAGAALAPLAFRAPALAQPATLPVRGRFSAEKLSRIDAYFDNEIATGKIPGAIVLIQRGGDPVYQRFFGVRDIATGQPMTVDTIFRIFSMTKPVTAVIAMMLVDQGQLSLDDPVAKYIPSFGRVSVGVEVGDGQKRMRLEMTRLERQMRVVDLLRHSSGLTYGFYGESLVRKAYASADLFRPPLDNGIFAERLAQLPLSEQPSTMWDYGHSSDILGRVIEVVTGQTLYRTQKRLLLDPLRMSDTGFYVSDPAKHPLIAQPLPDDRTFVAAMERDPRIPIPWEPGGSGMVSTTRDYARFAQMLLNGGSLDGHRFLSPKAYATMTANHIEPVTAVRRGPFYFPGDGFGYGLGFGVRISRGEFDPPGAIGEIKWDGAGGTYFFVDRTNDLFVLFMVQSPRERGRIHPALKKMVYDALET